MLRVEFREISGLTMMHMEGRFVGRFAEDARDLVLRCDSPAKLVLDLSDVNYVDGIGERVLSCFRQLRVKFIAESSYSRDVCARLKLPLLRAVTRA